MKALLFVTLPQGALPKKLQSVATLQRGARWKEAQSGVVMQWETARAKDHLVPMRALSKDLPTTARALSKALLLPVRARSMDPQPRMSTHWKARWSDFPAQQSVSHDLREMMLNVRSLSNELLLLPVMRTRLNYLMSEVAKQVLPSSACPLLLLVKRSSSL